MGGTVAVVFAWCGEPALAYDPHPERSIFRAVQPKDST